METDFVIETVNLTRSYNHQKAVDSLSFTVNEGEVFGFLGPNGAGKSTTLLMLLGLSRPSGGSAKVCGLDPLRDSRKVKRRVGYLPENVGFYADLDAVQSLEYVAGLNGIQKNKVSEKIDELLDLIGLKKDARKKVGAYSRGMKQRLGIAEVLIKDPKVLFLDELPDLGHHDAQELVPFAVLPRPRLEEPGKVLRPGRAPGHLSCLCQPGIARLVPGRSPGQSRRAGADRNCRSGFSPSDG